MIYLWLCKGRLISIYERLKLYSAHAQDGPQEMERNQSTAKHVVWPSCAWVLLSFFPYPVGHPEHEHCTYFYQVRVNWSLIRTNADLMQ